MLNLESLQYLSVFSLEILEKVCDLALEQVPPKPHDSPDLLPPPPGMLRPGGRVSKRWLGSGMVRCLVVNPQPPTDCR